MVKQGSVIRVDLNPQRGHEQAGRRPCIVVSSDYFNRLSCFVVVCPITNTNNKFPLHVALDSRTRTTGFVLCEHIRSLDINTRGYDFIEAVPDDILDRILNVLSLIIRK